MSVYRVVILSLFLLSFQVAGDFFSNEPKQKRESCFCQLKGILDDCTCNVDTVDYFNNHKIYPRLSSLLVQDYFRFYKVNLKRPCPFWSDDSRCAIRHCHVEACLDEDIPQGLKGYRMATDIPQPIVGPGFESGKVLAEKHTNPENCDDLDTKLGFLNTSISPSAKKDFDLWKRHDDAKDNFCDINANDQEAEYVDLLLNPERYTGYKGPSAHRIWRSIYKENCFRPDNSFHSQILSSTLNNMCLEKRAFYRVISGLHASINIHLCSKYLLSEKKNVEFVSPSGKWGPNLPEFHRRFDPEITGGEGPQWLRNLYFVYLLELRALEKASPYLEREQYYTGNSSVDADVKMAIKDLLSVIKSFPEHFNESGMFNNGFESRKLKEEFRQHFLNISRIMDCVGCDKCKLWGKLQIQGLGTALKILFSGKFDGVPAENSINTKKFQLERNEIVALLNAFGRLSTSIHELEEFRKMVR